MKKNAEKVTNKLYTKTIHHKRSTQNWPHYYSFNAESIKQTHLRWINKTLLALIK